MDTTAGVTSGQNPDFINLEKPETSDADAISRGISWNLVLTILQIPFASAGKWL